MDARTVRDADAPDRPRVELTWPGKTRAKPDRTMGQPAPTLSLLERHALPTGDRHVGGEGWRDALVRGDNLAVLQALLAEPWRSRIAAAGGVRLIYLDPPFLTGQEVAAEVRIGDGPGPDGRPRLARLPAFRDAGPRDLPLYLAEMRERLALVRDLLADDGSLYLHCDHRLNAQLRLLLDEVFGPDRFVNEIVWHYGLGNPGGARAFARKHDTILLYAKTDRYRFNRLRGEVTRAMAAKYRHEDEQGRYMLAYGRTYRLKGGKPLDSVWEIPTIAATSTERLGYPTQKPEALLERIVRAASDPGDLVADLCCGCGTLPAVAARLDRRWLACDAGRLAIHATRTRLRLLGDRLAAAGQPARGFDVLTLDGGQPDPSPLVYEAHPRAEVVVERGAIAVHLRGLDIVAPPCDPEALAQALPAGQQALAIADGHLWRLARDRRGQALTRQLTRCWTDWLDGWSVGIGTEGSDGAIEIQWHAARGRRERALPLASDPIRAARSTDDRVVVRCFTILGDDADAMLALPPNPSAERPAAGTVAMD